MADGVTDGVGVRLIDAGRVAPLQAQAIHHGVADAMALGHEPVVVLADPETPFISIGAHQDVSREIDLRFCRHNDLPVLRRATGGPALWLAPNNMMVHIIVPRARPESSGPVGPLYVRFVEPLLRTWQAFGIPVTRAIWGGVELARYRIGGLQIGFVGTTLMVGASLVTDFDPDTIARQAGLPSDVIRGRIGDVIREQLSQAGQAPDRAAVKDALLAHLGSLLGWTLQESTLRDDERAAVARREAQMVQIRHLHAAGQRLANADQRARDGLTVVNCAHRGTGGLAHLRLLERAGVIEEIEITGELLPLSSDGLDKLAARLVGLRRDAPDLALRIQNALNLAGLELPGLTATEIAMVLRSA